MIETSNRMFTITAFAVVASTIFLSLMIPQASAEGGGDDPIADAVQDLGIRGAAILWYDKHQSGEPMMRAFGKSGSGANAADITTNTAFMLASVSKVFAGAAVAVLVEKGIIESLDDDICNVLPQEQQLSSACRNPNHPNVPITWRMLVTHRSSLTGDIPTASAGLSSGDDDAVVDDDEIDDDDGFGDDDGVEDDDDAGVEVSYAPNEANPGGCPLTDVRGFYLDFLVDKETETTVGSGIPGLNWYDLGEIDGGAYETYRPGSRREYSNLAIGYIAALVEYATGEDFETFCQENIFGPLGMQDTSWFREELPQGTRVAMPVEFFGTNDFENYGHYCFIDYASGQLYSSIEDLQTFCKVMVSLGVPSLWSEEMGRIVTSCQERDEGGNALGTNCEYGSTWELVKDSYRGSSDAYVSWLSSFERYDWTNGIMHSGAEAGVQTQIIVLPKAGVYAVVLTNTDMNSDLAAQTLTALLADQASIPAGTRATDEPNQSRTNTPTSSTVSSSRPPQQFISVSAASSAAVLLFVALF